jgi:glycosyltransferase involved in cell wall biosynthesis
MAGAPWGGSEELWSQTALHLKDEGHEISAAVKWWPKLSPKVIAMADAGIDLFLIKPLEKGLLRRFWRRIKVLILKTKDPETQWLLSRKPDLVIISQGGISDGLTWMERCNKYGFPYIVKVSCNFDHIWPSDEEADRLAVSYKQAKKIYFVSHHNHRLLENQIGYELINARIIWSQYEVIESKSMPWPDTSEGFKMACVGRLDTNAKGQDIILEVLAMEKWRNRKVILNIYGQGQSQNVLMRHAKRLNLNNVFFKGHANKIKEIWNENHILVMPSRYEGLPLALLEAMWAARPAVVTDVGGSAEICVEGVTGFIADAPTYKLFDIALENAWEKRLKWENIGANAKVHVMSKIDKSPAKAIGKDIINISKNV